MAPLQSVSRTAARIGLATFVAAAFALLMHGRGAARGGTEERRLGQHLDGIGPADARPARHRLVQRPQCRPAALRHAARHRRQGQHRPEHRRADRCVGRRDDVQADAAQRREVLRRHALRRRRRGEEFPADHGPEEPLPLRLRPVHHRLGRGHRAARGRHQDEVAVGALPRHARRRRRHGRVACGRREVRRRLRQLRHRRGPVQAEGMAARRAGDLRAQPGLLAQACPTSTKSCCGRCPTSRPATPA